MSAVSAEEGGGFPGGRRWIKKCLCCRGSGQAQNPTYWSAQRGGPTPSVSSLTHRNPDPNPKPGPPSPFAYNLGELDHRSCPNTGNSSVP